MEDSWSLLRNKILVLRDRYVPRKSKKQFWRKKGKFAIDQQLQQAIKDKRRNHRKWIRSINTNAEIKQRKNYIAARNKVKRGMNQARKRLEKRICNVSKENPKSFWKHVRGSLKTKSAVSPLLRSPTDENSVKFLDEDKANILQDQFCSVFTNEPPGNLPDFYPRTESVVNVELSIEMIRKEITSLNPNKSLGPDEIHPIMMKELIDYIDVPLYNIIQKSLTDGVLPADWKVAHVTPIYKKGPKDIAENYRPVSLTSIACRIMEKLIKNQIMNHLTIMKLLSKKQHGFMNKRSTVTQLLSYLDKCEELISNSRVVDVIYLDFAKAFDTVPHRRLLKKLEAYGIQGNELNQSFSNRSI